MKKILIIPILLILLGIGCNSENKLVLEQEKKNQDLKAQLDSLKSASTSVVAEKNDLFEKKQDCQRYEKEISEKVKSNNFYVAKTNANSYNYLQKIFYSPKANSCLYVYLEVTYVNEKREWDSFTLVDALTNNIISSNLIKWGESDYPAKKQNFDDLIKEYE